MSLPESPVKHWTAPRKAAVVCAVHAGEISRQDALARYDLSGAEFESWLYLYKKYGTRGLHTTRYVR